MNNNNTNVVRDFSIVMDINDINVSLINLEPAEEDPRISVLTYNGSQLIIKLSGLQYIESVPYSGFQECRFWIRNKAVNDFLQLVRVHIRKLLKLKDNNTMAGPVHYHPVDNKLVIKNTIKNVNSINPESTVSIKIVTCKHIRLTSWFIMFESCPIETAPIVYGREMTIRRLEYLNNRTHCPPCVTIDNVDRCVDVYERTAFHDVVRSEGECVRTQGDSVPRCVSFRSDHGIKYSDYQSFLTGFYEQIGTLSTAIVKLLMKYNNDNNYNNGVKFFIAGGSVVGTLFGFPFSDVDVFILENGQGPDVANKVLIDVLRQIDEDVLKGIAMVAITTNNFTINISDNLFIPIGKPIQFVLKRFTNIEDLLIFFDIDCCRFGFDHQSVKTVPEGLRSIRTWKNYCCHLEKIQRKRIEKYVSRTGMDIVYDCKQYSSESETHMYIPAILGTVENQYVKLEYFYAPSVVIDANNSNITSIITGDDDQNLWTKFRFIKDANGKYKDRVDSTTLSEDICMLITEYI